MQHNQLLITVALRDFLGRVLGAAWWVIKKTLENLSWFYLGGSVIAGRASKVTEPT